MAYSLTAIKIEIKMSQVNFGLKIYFGQMRKKKLNKRKSSGLFRSKTHFTKTSSFSFQCSNFVGFSTCKINIKTGFTAKIDLKLFTFLF